MYVTSKLLPFTVWNRVRQMPKRNLENTSVNMDMVALATKMQILIFDLLRISERHSSLFFLNSVSLEDSCMYSYSSAAKITKLWCILIEIELFTQIFSPYSAYA